MEMCEKHYSFLEKIECGGELYFYLILFEMFQMIKDIVTALKKTFANFKEQGLNKNPRREHLRYNQIY